MRAHDGVPLPKADEMFIFEIQKPHSEIVHAYNKFPELSSVSRSVQFKF